MPLHGGISLGKRCFTAGTYSLLVVKCHFLIVKCHFMKKNCRLLKKNCLLLKKNWHLG